MAATPMTVAELTRAMQNRPDDDTLAALVSAVRRYQHLGRELTRWAQTLRDDMDAVIKRVADGRGVNSLGEVQSTGLQVDRLCALREAKADEIRVLAHLVGVDPTGLLTPGDKDR